MACQLATEAVYLVQLVGKFQAQFGREYRLKPGSPPVAWELDQAIQAQQTLIARLLDLAALEGAFSRYGCWWTRCDVMDDGIAHELAAEATRLVSACAHAESKADQVEWSPAIQVIQQSIAGMLPPHIRMMGSERSMIHTAM